MTLTDVRPVPPVPPVPEVPRAAVIEEARRRRRRRRVVILTVVLVGVLSLGFVAGGGSATRPHSNDHDPFAGLTTSPDPSSYTATSTLSVAMDDIGIDTDPRPGHVSRDGGLERLFTTFRAVLESRHVVRQAVEVSGVRRMPADVARATDAKVGARRNLIDVSVTDRAPRVALALSNAIAEAFEAQINDLRPATDPFVSTYERAKLDR